jgi:hypothetical protein
MTLFVDSQWIVGHFTRLQLFEILGQTTLSKSFIYGVYFIEAICVIVHTPRIIDFVKDTGDFCLEQKRFEHIVRNSLTYVDFFCIEEVNSTISELNPKICRHFFYESHK